MTPPLPPEDEIARLRQEQQQRFAELAQLTERLVKVEAELNAERAWRDALQRSLPWRLSRPLRWVLRLLRR